MLTFTEPYQDWKDFFTKKLLDSGYFILSHTLSKGDTDVQSYSALKGNLNTTIEVGYFSPMTLIYVNILNPETPGKNKQQEAEHLYKYDFHSEKQYGPPGLDFNETNVRGMEHFLNQGFNGKELVYFKNGKPIMSKLTTSYYPDSPSSTFTYYFDHTSVVSRLAKNLLKVGDKYDEVREIDLKKIFTGLNGG
jgi:hypothetical protein